MSPIDWEAYKKEQRERNFKLSRAISEMPVAKQPSIESRRLAHKSNFESERDPVAQASLAKPQSRVECHKLQ